MKIQLIQVPFDSGHENVRTGKGPRHFLKHGLKETLQADGHEVSVDRIASNIPLPTEIGTMIDVNRSLAGSVRKAVDQKRLPVILAGNCNSCVGVLSGLDPTGLGIIWMDAHGDFNTPETTTTGFLDGMGLAMATGRCWRALLGTIPGFLPVAVENVVQVGARDLDAEEERMLIQAGIPLVASHQSEQAKGLEALDDALTLLENRVDSVYLHIDMDVLKTEQGRPNHLAVAGGLTLQFVENAIARIKERFKIQGCAVSSFDPDLDAGDCVLNAGISILKAIVDG